MRSCVLIMVAALLSSCFSETAGTGTNADEGTTASGESTTATTGATTGDSASSTASSSTSSMSSSTMTSDTMTSATMTTSVDTSASESESGSGTDTGECGPGMVMSSAPTLPWEGPFMLLPPDAGGCMDLLTDGDPAMVRGAPVAAETCECTCAGECDLRVFTDPECQSLNGTIGALDSACVSLPANATIRNGNAAAAASCDAPAASAPTVAFDLHHRLCDAPPDTCVPVPAGAVGLCVRRPGEHECMDPEFGQQIVTMTDVQLECEDCGPCGRTLGLACGEAILTQYSDLLCTNDAVVLESNMCSLNTVGSARMDFNFSCPASDVQATEINITTYCCA